MYPSKSSMTLLLMCFLISVFCVINKAVKLASLREHNRTIKAENIALVAPNQPPLNPVKNKPKVINEMLTIARLNKLMLQSITIPNYESINLVVIGRFRDEVRFFQEIRRMPISVKQAGFQIKNNEVKLTLQLSVLPFYFNQTSQEFSSALFTDPFVALEEQTISNINKSPYDLCKSKKPFEVVGYLRQKNQYKTILMLPTGELCAADLGESNK